MNYVRAMVAFVLGMPVAENHSGSMIKVCEEINSGRTVSFLSSFILSLFAILINTGPLCVQIFS